MEAYTPLGDGFAAFCGPEKGFLITFFLIFQDRTPAPIYSLFVGTDGLITYIFMNTHLPYSDHEDGGCICLRNVGKTVHIGRRKDQREKSTLTMNHSENLKLLNK
jgi:hypothetical protein